MEFVFFFLKKATLKKRTCALFEITRFNMSLTIETLKV